MHVDAVTSGGGRWPKDGKRACQTCGGRFVPFPRQRVLLCPFHRRIYLAQLESERKARWRAKVRLLAALYSAGQGPPRSRS